MLVRETTKPGTLLGVYDLLFAPAYRTRARTMQSCTLLRIDATALNRLIYRFPQVRQHLAPMKMISRLRTIPMLGRLEPVALGFLADAFGEKVTFAAGQSIYTLNEVEDRIFFIDQGQVRIDLADGPHWLGNGAAFGMLAHSGTRTIRAMDHSAHAESNTDVFAIDHRLFVSITGLNPEQRAAEEMQRREETIDNLVVFHRLSKDQRRRLTGFMSHYYFPANHHLIQQGEEADSLWVLLAGGHAAIHALDGHGNKMLTTITTGVTYFGETALLGQMPQDSSIEAQAGSEWLRLHWTDFRQFVDNEPGNLRHDIEVRTKRQAVVASEQQRQKYAWLQPGELLILLSRRHWIAFLRKGIPAFILFAVLLAIAIFGASIPGYQLWIAVPAGVLAVIALLAFIWGAIDYFNDWVVVTNRRVVHQEKVLFVNEWRKEAPLEQIQDVSFRTTFLGRWLNYGTMIIQTASTSGVISFDYTQHFDQLDNVIKQQRELRQRHSAAQSKLVIHRRLEERLGLNLVFPSRAYRAASRGPKSSRPAGRSGCGGARPIAIAARRATPLSGASTGWCSASTVATLRVAHRRVCYHSLWPGARWCRRTYASPRRSSSSSAFWSRLRRWLRALRGAWPIRRVDRYEVPTRRSSMWRSCRWRWPNSAPWPVWPHSERGNVDSHAAPLALQLRQCALSDRG
ncbi:MAG: cyclic nucleotide-binding domain-containing protein [Caldilineaceae bacterium]